MPGSPVRVARTRVALQRFAFSLVRGLGPRGLEPTQKKLTQKMLLVPGKRRFVSAPVFLHNWFIQGAQQMHRSLPTSVLVTERDAGEHGVFALGGNGHADRIGADYLVRGTLPARDKDIPGHPLPDASKPSSEPVQAG